MSVERRSQALPDHLEYAVDYHEEVQEEAEDERHGTAAGELALNTHLSMWLYPKYNAHRLPQWNVYMSRLRERFGEHVMLKAMNPDGTWREWEPEEMDA